MRLLKTILGLMVFNLRSFATLQVYLVKGSRQKNILRMDSVAVHL